jgi:hypothetical protein
MITAFFIPGAIVLLRARPRQLLRAAALVLPPTILTAVAVDAYAAPAVPTAGFSGGFTFAEPAVLTQDWVQANVALATAAAFGLLAVWIGVVLVLPRWRAVVLAGLAAVSLVAVLQLTSHVSQRSEIAQRADTTGLLAMTGLRPGQQIAIATGLTWVDWMPLSYEVNWTQLEFFNPVTQPPPADADVVVAAWPTGLPAQDSWPQATPTWSIVAEDGVISAADDTGGWVAWRRAR